MKKFVIAAALAALSLCAFAQNRTPKNVKYNYVEASTLTLVGKLCPDTPNPYHRIDTVKYKGFTKHENCQVRCASGIMVAFKTNSTSISLITDYGYLYEGVTTNKLAHRGYDLYIKQNGKWMWASAKCPEYQKESKPISLIKNMDGTEHECLLYLPLYSEVRGLKIGVDEGTTLEALENPFRYRVGIFGSSYTHGVSCGRGGMTYPAQFSRNTGIQLLSIACSGNCKLQPYFAEVLKDADVDAFIFDTFSNPTIDQIKERLFPFIEKIQSTHPGVPMIFQRTIYRENRRFDTLSEYNERTRIEVADSLMAIACKKYKDVYYIHPNATEDNHEASIDGIHPSNYGYELWEQSIEKKVLKILRKYGIK
ncbi:MAG: SGNH/GDSL hydrolase family protein [Bacteroidales bacterium]|nr:SGNH/GDSL hydrolase family protein [Bacteroidales bacterium]